MAKRPAAKSKATKARGRLDVKATSPENPSFNLNDPMAWEVLGSGEPSATGEKVSAQRALTYSPWWRGINLLSRDCGKLPCQLYRRISDERGEGKERAQDHPAYHLIRWQPNEFQTAMDFREQLSAHAISKGNGYAWINRETGGIPLELLPLDPDSTYPVREDGRLWYVTDVDGQTIKVPADQILHLHGFSSDGICGLDVVTAAREALGLGIGGQRYAATVLKNGGRPSVVLEHPTNLNDTARDKLRTSWERMHSGIDNAHRTAILDNGLKAHTLSFSAEDQQLIEQRKFTIVDIANFLGVPPHKLGDDSKANYASLEQENQSYLDDGLDYWLCRWEFAYWSKLLTEDEKRADTHVIEFTRAALVRADLSARAAYYRTALAGQPWMTQDEVRAKENLNPMGGDAAELQMPLNMGQGGAANDNPDPSGPPPGRPSKNGVQK